ncbi:MAG: serine hydrolase [Clostridia bacterium]|nr:serine hydrolase [Clostridia bacterium]
MVNDLIFKTPEEEGLDSKYVLKFLKILERRKVNLHSFMLVRHGNIIAEGYYKPFHKDFMHRLYSSSKTYVSMAVGLLIGEGKLKLDDKILDHFPEYKETEYHKWLKDTTVEDALKMSVPMLTDTYFMRDYKEWAWTFFNHPTRSRALKPAGTVFNYNTSGSFILDVLVEKITGKPFLEYMRPVFDKIGVSKDIWCVKAPDGYSWGGSGVVCTTRDFAKFGELLLNKGEYKGEQLLPRDYVEKATSKQIANLTDNYYSDRHSAGYGYQVWVNEKGFSLLGMGSQFAFCFPDKDFMFVCNGDTQCNNDTCGDYIYEAVRCELYDNLKDGAIAPNEAAQEELKKRLSNLEPPTFGEARSQHEGAINGKIYDLEENRLGWKWVRFDLDGKNGKLTYENARGVKTIGFTLGEYKKATFPETCFYDTQVDKPANRELDSNTYAGWLTETQLLIANYIIDTNFGSCFMTFGFKGDEVGIMLNKRAEFFMEDYEGYAGGTLRK